MKTLRIQTLNKIWVWVVWYGCWLGHLLQVEWNIYWKSFFLASWLMFS